MASPNGLVPTLIADVYEPEEIRSKLADILMSVEDLTKDNLGGDYIWVSDLGKTWSVERKSVQDFIQSFHSGRLTAQLRQIVANYDYPLLLIEGLITQTDEGNVLVPQRGRGIQNFPFKYTQVQDIFLEAQLTGITLQFSTSKLDTARQLRRLYHWSNREEHKLLDKRRKILEYSKMDQRVSIMTAIPGIGPETAKQLIEAFRTPWAALSMFQGEGGSAYLKNIKGLGAGKIAAVRKVMFE